MRLRANATHLPLAAASVHCVVTSPPYNVGIEYPGYEDKLPWHDYITMSKQAAKEMYRVLVPGGRAWINVQASVPLEPGGERMDMSAIWRVATAEAGFFFRDYVVWIQDSHDGACAWGSWNSPSAPNLRGGHEFILLCYKERWKRGPSKHAICTPPPRVDLGGDWTDLVRNVWKIRPARNIYPATFPIELPARCIRLSTWPGETVLDPFVGSGTTLAAAAELGRVGIGTDLA